VSLQQVEEVEKVEKVEKWKSGKVGSSGSTGIEPATSSLEIAKQPKTRIKSGRDQHVSA